MKSNEKIKWGPVIPVTGRPDWLKDDVPCMILDHIGWVRCHGMPDARNCHWDGTEIAIRVPHDHPAAICQEWNNAHLDEPPFVPWCGGMAAPYDYDQLADVLRRDGSCDTIGSRYSVWWRHGVPEVEHEIIGYRKKKVEKETEMKKKKFTSGKSNENIFDKPWQYITPKKGYLGGLIFTPCKGQYTYTTKQAMPEVKNEPGNVCYSYSTRIGYNLARKMTIAYWTGGKNNNIIYIATAVCNPTDEFSKKEGRKVVDQHIREGKYIALPFSGNDPYNVIRGIYEFLEDENV